jgi:hypothetical protein
MKMNFNNLSAMSKIFKEAFENFPEVKPMSEQDVAELKKRQETEEYIDSLPELLPGTYKVRLLQKFDGGWDYLKGEIGDIVEVSNCGVRSNDRSMGTRHRAGCINIDGGMSPSWLFIPGIHVEILERL